MKILYILLMESMEAYMDDKYYGREANSGVGNNIDRLERDGYQIIPSLNITVMSADDMIRVEYQVENTWNRLVVNEKVYIRFKPELLDGDSD